MNISPTSVSTPKFGALYKSAEEEVKGDQIVNLAAATAGSASLVTSVISPAAPLSVTGLGIGLFMEGLFRLFGLKPHRKLPPGLKVGTDDAKLNVGAKSVAGGALGLALSAAGPVGPISAGFGGAAMGIGLGNVYDGLKGKPEVKAPEY
jgi:hypothetical protein